MTSASLGNTLPSPRTVDCEADLLTWASGASSLIREMKQAMKAGDWTSEIVKRSDTARGFLVLPSRWVVERTLAWLNRNRRLAKDFERTIESATAWIFLASVQFITHKIARR